MVVTDSHTGGKPSAVAGTDGFRAEARMHGIHADHARALLRFLATLLPAGSRHTAEDLLQETMLRTWRNLDSVPTEPEDQRRWLFTVARRLAIDDYRMRRARPVEVSLVTESHLTSGDETTEAVLAAHSVRHALAQLSSAHRAVLFELYVRGCSPDETAARLRIPVGTVKSRAHYALRAIRHTLAAAD
jgi:RNA polymerase sigma-70 factor (ECF subfamily)